MLLGSCGARCPAGVLPSLAGGDVEEALRNCPLEAPPPSCSGTLSFTITMFSLSSSTPATAAFCSSWYSSTSSSTSRSSARPRRNSAFSSLFPPCPSPLRTPPKTPPGVLCNTTRCADDPAAIVRDHRKSSCLSVVFLNEYDLVIFSRKTPEKMALE